MTITAKESIAAILGAFPGFIELWSKHLQDWAPEEQRPFGLDIGEFSHFACGIIIDGSNDDIRKIILLTETLITNGNDEVKRAFKFDFPEM